MSKNKKEKWEKIASEYVVSLFPLFMLVDAADRGIKEIIDYPAYIMAKIENNNIEWYHLPNNWGKSHLALVKRIKKSPSFLREVFIQMGKLGKNLVAYTKLITKNLEHKSNKTLNNYYQKYIRENTKVYTYGLILPLLDFQKTTFLSDELNRLLKKRGDERYFQILTTPLRETFNRKQELNLLKILVEIKKNNNLIKKFKNLNSDELINEIKLNHKKIWRLINQHTKKYCWVHYVYEGPAADQAYFLEAIRNFIKRKIDPRKELIAQKKNRRELKEKQRRIIKRLKLSYYEKQIIKLARDAVFFKAYRRELQSWSYYYIESLLKEIAVRTNLTLRQTRVMLPEEITRALLKNKIDEGDVNERIKLVIYHRKNGRTCLTGSQAREFIKNKIKKSEVIKISKKLAGSIAFRGKVKGRVKIINSPSEIVKMKINDILVSASTNPNLMPAIRQAAAIITDEGGLTCHAAIVARELRIPCIVGTKFATKILKDGDLVEVDATIGIVKKIK